MFTLPDPETDPEELALLNAEPAPYVGDQREPESWPLKMGGIVFDLYLTPHPRDVRLWYVYRDGEPWIGPVGREHVWRRMQSEVPRPLGRKHWL